MDRVKDLVRLVCDVPFYLWTVISVIVSEVLKTIFMGRKRKSLDHEIVLVNGAATGIGRECVLKLAKISQKATFVLWDINETGLLQTCEECRKLGATSVYPYVVDLSKREQVISTAYQVKKQVGTVTILFNNAGISPFNTFLDANEDLEQKTIEINLLSYMWTIRQFLPDMIERGSGHIVNTCSGLAHARCRYLTGYVASKYGLRGFLDCLKLEMKIHPDKPNIRFTTIYPGWVKTGLTTGVSWEPRYKTFEFMRHQEPDYVAEEIVDGILKEKEEVYVPRAVKLAGMLYGLYPSQLVDRFESFMYRNIKIVTTTSNSVIVSTTTLKNGNYLPKGGAMLSSHQETKILMPEETKSGTDFAISM